MKIAIAGEFRRGKDTVANIIEASLLTDKQVTRLAFADALKTEVSEMTFDYVKADSYENSAGMTLRNDASFSAWDAHMHRLRPVNGLAWQWWGEFRRQTEGEHYWINHPQFQCRYKDAVRDGHHVLITDVRQHNEAAWCRRNGFYCIRIEGPCRAFGETRDPQHPSEIHIPDLEVDAVLVNEGTMNDLTRSIHELLEQTILPFFGE